VGSIDSLDGLPCRAGEADEGVVELAYEPAGGSGRGIALTCVATNLHTLSVTKQGGSGTVAGGAIHCGETCTAGFAPGASVTLTATAAPGYRFTGWSGDCSGSGACEVTMDSNKAVEASFVRQFQLTLLVDVDEPFIGSAGNGVVNVSSSFPCQRSGAGSEQCTRTFDAGTAVTLSASGSAAFTGWGGDCSGTTPLCTVTMDATRFVTAHFN
jgi:uncharacterized repeat protein (TIGR02543 family)